MFQNLTETNHIVLGGFRNIEAVSPGNILDTRLLSKFYDTGIDINSPVFNAEALVCSRHSTRAAAYFKHAKARLS